MDLKETTISGCFELHPSVFKDTRGKLVKTFHRDTFNKFGLAVDFAEEYYSVSHKGVLRGLHLQLPPFDHIKCVTSLHGKIFDVVVDLRRQSPSFGKYYTTILDSDAGNMLYIPSGCAHGFYAVTDQAIFLNRTTTVFNATAESGIRWDSCDIPWPSANPILSDKDKNLPAFSEFGNHF